MATYEVKGPQGEVYHIDGPEGADPSAVIAQITGAHKPQQMMAVGGQAVPMNSPQVQESQNPTAGNSFLQNALIGSGKAFTDLGLGARQVWAQAMDAIAPRSQNLSGLITGAQPSRLAALEQEAAQKRQTDAPVSDTAGGKIGQAGTSLLTALPLSAIPGAGTYAGAAAIGGAMGALTPTTQGESRALNTGAGAVLGAAGKGIGDKVGGWLASRAPKPVITSTLNPAQQQAAAGGQALGMRLTPGQASGSTALQQLEAKLESQPWTSGPLNAIKEGNSAALGGVAARSIGETGTSVDATVLDSAATRLGKVFESVRSPNSIVAIDPKASTAVLDQIEQGAEGLITGNVRDNPLVGRFQKLIDSGAATGEQLGSLSSKLGRAAYKQMSGPNGDRDLGQALYQVKDHVDDLLESSLSGKEQAAYAAARQQYRNLMLLTSRVGITNPSSGVVSGGALANKLQQADRPGFLYGRNQSDLYNAARFAQAFKPVVGNSGTPTRSLGLADIATAGYGIPMNLASRAYFSRPGQAIMPGLMAAPTLGRNALAATGRGAGGLLQRLPPGAGGALVPYLRQQ